MVVSRERATLKFSGTTGVERKRRRVAFITGGHRKTKFYQFVKKKKRKENDVEWRARKAARVSPENPVGCAN